LDLRGRKWQETGEECIMGSFAKHYYGDQINENEMDGHVALVGDTRNA